MLLNTAKLVVLTKVMVEEGVGEGDGVEVEEVEVAEETTKVVDSPTVLVSVIAITLQLSGMPCLQSNGHKSVPAEMNVIDDEVWLQSITTKLQQNLKLQILPTTTHPTHPTLVLAPIR